MRDIPVFTTQFGVASLILKEIPYTQTAYIRICSSADPAELLKECRDFCRAVGARKIYASGKGMPASYPAHTEVLEMQVQKMDLPTTTASLRPVTEETLEVWRQHYNNRMTNVANASWMDKDGALDVLKKESGYFIHEDGVPIGIGMVQENTLMAVVALRKGAGRDVVLALSNAVKDDCIRLEVASVNFPAMRLYERLGFKVLARKSVWYKVF